MALAQLMIALDATIVSIALPSAQRALHASDAERQWVLTAYALAFGCLLLLGGRVSDAIGRKPAFLIGLAGFATASAVGGVAPVFWVLVTARAMQGAFAALLAPTVLSLVAVTFTEPRERARAFAVYGTIAGTGAAVGLVVGGVVTENLTWRWCLYVNVPIALLAATGGILALRTPLSTRRSGLRFDVLGLVLATAALASLVIACSEAVSAGWGSVTVVTPLGLCAVLLVLFVVWEQRCRSPLVPLSIVLDPTRGGAYLAAAFAVASMSGVYLILTYYLQEVLGYTPLQAGLAFLPLPAASQLVSWTVVSRLVPRLPPRALMAPGAVVAALGMGILTLLPGGGGYLTHVLPAEILLGGGISGVMVPAFSVATLGLDPGRAGVGSALANAATQIGGSVGVALLNTVAAGATAAYLALHGSAAM
ncbi:MAG: MFS transporter, partial [Candidatus Dormibacteraeota bacterium]|nr:MFS transporter [Candidatus Dormibacteraeota bacterium]